MLRYSDVAKRLRTEALRRRLWIRPLFASLLVGANFVSWAHAQQSDRRSEPHQSFIKQYCISCHNSGQDAQIKLEEASPRPVEENLEVWEKVVRKLRGRQMPPLGFPRPDEEAYDAAVASLELSLDRAAEADSNPGRTDAFRRLTRTEYQNAVRDLLALELDLAALLPRDESSQGFDNITVADLSPTLLESYVTAADKISRLAVGRPVDSLVVETYKKPPDLTQEWPVDGLPLGTRGGTRFTHNFPVDADYQIVIRLMRDRDEQVEGLREPHQIELLLDRERLRLFEVVPPRHVGDHSAVDTHLKARIPVSAGPHEIGVTFLKRPWAVLETDRQPYQAHYNVYRHPRLQPAVYEVAITGPYDAKGPGRTPSRDRIFTCRPESGVAEDGCVKQILATLMRRAYRREVGEGDFETPLEFYRQGRAGGGFEAGIEMALSSILVSPEFLFRVERDPAGVAPNTSYRISDVELASRLSFFLWSSIPDDELLDLAIAGDLSKPGVVETQARRMLADTRAKALVTNFGSQWLHLRNLESARPDMRLFPSFDDNLRQAMRRETELHLETVLERDRSVLELISSEYTFLNERLAKHYGIPHVYGSWFRKVSLDGDSKRGGLLRQGSILTVTSYNTRTSPVVRGHWVLENLLGVPPPPPPAAVPALEEKTISGSLSVRERLMEHRANPACASCHNLMDPVGFSLEHYDAVGRWRDTEGDLSIDSAGALPGGAEFNGVGGLEEALLEKPELFVSTLVEKLLTYSLGRVVDYYDAPSVRKIVRDASAEDYRFSSIIVGIVESRPFQMRRSQ